jgi:ankyrin repeat protein
MVLRLLATAHLLAPIAAWALQCPPMPQQVSRDTEVEVKVGVRLLGDAKGAELETRTRQLTTDLLGKVPRADRVYLEQMLFATYCSAVRDNAALTETERESRVASYGREMRRAMVMPAPSAPSAPKEDPRDTARAELVRLAVPYTPVEFHRAVRRGDLRAVRLFVAAGMDLETEDRDGWRPLKSALAERQMPVADVLIDAGAAAEGGALVQLAAVGDEARLQRLLSRKPSRESIDAAFAMAASYGQLGAVRLLAQRGADLQASGPRAVELIASRTGHDPESLRGLEWLHAQGVPLDTSDKEGWTPLMQALARGSPETVRAFLRLGADVNRRCACSGYLEGDMTPLLIATQGDSQEALLALLLDAGADPTAVTGKRRTSLHIVTESGFRDPKVPRLLMERGVPIDSADDDGQTPLMWMVVRNTALARELVARGARVNARTSDGRTPLSFAAVRDADTSISMLLDAGAAIEGRTETGRTVLAIAVRNAAVDSVRLLLQRGARADAADRDGLKPLDHALALAQGEARTAIVRLLQNVGARP